MSEAHRWTNAYNARSVYRAGEVPIDCGALEVDQGWKASELNQNERQGREVDQNLSKLPGEPVEIARAWLQEALE